MIWSDRRMDVACKNDIDTAIGQVGVVLSSHRSRKGRH